MMGATSGAGSAYPSPQIFSEVHVVRSLVFCYVDHCLSFVLSFVCPIYSLIAPLVSSDFS